MSHLHLEPSGNDDSSHATLSPRSNRGELPTLVPPSKSPRRADAASPRRPDASPAVTIPIPPVDSRDISPVASNQNSKPGSSPSQAQVDLLFSQMEFERRQNRHLVITQRRKLSPLSQFVNKQRQKVQLRSTFSVWNMQREDGKRRRQFENMERHMQNLEKKLELTIQNQPVMQALNRVNRRLDNVSANVNPKNKLDKPKPKREITPAAYLLKFHRELNENLIKKYLRRLGASNEFMITQVFRAWKGMAEETQRQIHIDKGRQMRHEIEDEYQESLQKLREEKFRDVMIFMDSSDQFLLKECFRAWQHHTSFEGVCRVATKDVRDAKIRKFLMKFECGNDFLLQQVFAAWSKQVSIDRLQKAANNTLDAGHLNKQAVEEAQAAARAKFAMYMGNNRTEGLLRACWLGWSGYVEREISDRKFRDAKLKSMMLMSSMDEQGLLQSAFQGWAKESQVSVVQREAQRLLEQADRQKEKDREDKIRKFTKLMAVNDDLVVLDCFRAWADDTRASTMERKHQAAIADKVAAKEEQVKQEKLRRFALMFQQNEDTLLATCFDAWSREIEHASMQRAAEYERRRLEQELERAKAEQLEELREVKLRKFFLQVNQDQDWLVMECFRGWKEIANEGKEATATFADLDEIEAKLASAEAELREEKMRKFMLKMNMSSEFLVGEVFDAWAKQLQVEKEASSWGAEVERLNAQLAQKEEMLREQITRKFALMFNVPDDLLVDQVFQGWARVTEQSAGKNEGTL